MPNDNNGTQNMPINGHIEPGLTASGNFYKNGHHLCAVCQHSFRTESQLFNHLDNNGKRLK